MLKSEVQLFQTLTKHADPNVRSAAAEVLSDGGDFLALMALYDQLLDYGEPREADQVLDLLAHYTTATEPRVLRRHYGLPSMSGARDDFFEAQPPVSVEEWPSAVAPINLEVMQEFMASRPDSPAYAQARAQREGPQQMRRSRGARRRYASQTEQELSFPEAFDRTQSADQQLAHEYGDQIMRQVGLKGKSLVGIGDYDGGSEQALLTEIPEPADMARLRYVAAWQGLTNNQRNVLVFAPHEGGRDSVYQLTVPETDAAKVRARLSQAGIPFRTIVPGQQGTRIMIYDQGRALRDHVARFAQAYNAPIRETIGRGDNVGGRTRADARAAFRDEIARFESSRGRRPGDAVPPR